MSDIFVNSITELERIKELLDKDVPTYRQAYSDRTAWLMACFSELAYLRFNPIFKDSSKEHFIAEISKLIDENRRPALLKLIDLVGYDHNKEKKDLEGNLSTLRIKLSRTFDNDGTQAILLYNDKFIVLAFRGTETSSIKDIKADAKAVSVPCETGGKIHQGFKEAFDVVASDIQNTLDKEDFSSKPLFITGHSLGGALATIAAKKIKHKGGIAGCYTFGAPRVGDIEWIYKMKTPIYRIVNAADCVTMLPPGTEIITAISWLTKFIPRIGENIQSFLISKFGGYIHCGYMRYLTNCPKGDYSKVKLIDSVSLFFRIKMFIIEKKPWKSFLSDHSIAVYRKKLAIIAWNRN